MAEIRISKIRWLSITLLGIALVMLVLGETLLAKSLSGRRFIFYWLACFVFTGLAAMTALIDFFAVRRRARIYQRELMAEVFSEAEKKKQNPRQLP